MNGRRIATAITGRAPRGGDDVIDAEFTEH